jgi:hypothetical protein
MRLLLSGHASEMLSLLMLLLALTRSYFFMLVGDMEWSVLK